MGLLFGFLVYGTSVPSLLYGRLFSLVHSYTLLAIPLFVFMGVMLERSGIAEKLYGALYMWLSGYRKMYELEQRVVSLTRTIALLSTDRDGAESGKR